LGEHETDVIGDMGRRRYETSRAEMFGKAEHIALGVRERIEPTATLVNDDDDPALIATIFHGATRALLAVELPAVPFQERGAGDLVPQVLDFSLFHHAIRGAPSALRLLFGFNSLPDILGDTARQERSLLDARARSPKIRRGKR
jgi:hypothetical protein